MRRAGSKARRATSGGITGCRCPQAVDLDALNAQLLAGCRADEARVIHRADADASARR